MKAENFYCFIRFASGKTINLKNLWLLIVPLTAIVLVAKGQPIDYHNSIKGNHIDNMLFYRFLRAPDVQGCHLHIDASVYGPNGEYSNDLYFNNWRNNSNIRFGPDGGKMVITSIGNVGINNISPQAQLDVNGNVLIGGGGTLGVNVSSGNMPEGFHLAVDGKIIAEEIRVELAGDDLGLWPDYVFNENYILMPIQELQKSIKQNGHLPGMPSAKEVKKNGIDVGEMNRKLLEKIEELTLYIIDLKWEYDRLKERLYQLEKK